MTVEREMTAPLNEPRDAEFQAVLHATLPSPPLGACPLDPQCTWTPVYPADYQDPEWSTWQDYNHVLACRMIALAGVFTEHLAYHGHEQMQVGWTLTGMTPGLVPLTT